MLNRLFRRSSQVVHRSPVQQEREERMREAYELVVDRIHRLEIAAKEIRAEVDAQAVALHKLRGRITGGIRYQEGARSVEEVPTGDRAALRRLAGIAPGKPFTHK